MRDLFIVSDLHLGEGRQDGRRYAPTEDFFFDEDFTRFLGHIADQYKSRPDKLSLVLNGDIFDFLTVTTIPSDKVAQKLGFRVTNAERRFGLNATALKSVFKLNLIAKGHFAFFEALSKFVKMGFRVEFTRGNHDLELFFTEVQDRLLEILSNVDDGASLGQLRQHVTFHQLFYREPGRVHIEHGHQYDATNSNRYPLTPVFVRNHKIRGQEFEEETLDYPLGSVFVKYFYNRVRQLDPYAPRLLSPEEYMDFIRRYNIFDVWRVYKDHYPYFLAALSPSTDVGAVEPSMKEAQHHEAESHQVAKDAGIAEFYLKWESLKRSPERANKAAVVKKAMAPLVRRGMWGGVFAFGVLYIWILFFMLIQEIPWLAANVFITSLFAATSIIAGFWGWSNFRKKLRFWKVSEHEMMKMSAEQLAEVIDAKVLIFGHSHQVENVRLKKTGVIYANSGTWTCVSNPWSRIVRDARRLTFAKVVGKDVELLRWNSEAMRIDPVPLFNINRIAEKVSNEQDGDDEIATSREHSWLPSAAVNQEDDKPDEYS